MSRKIRKKKLNRIIFLAPLAVLALLLILFFIFHKPKKVVSTIPSTSPKSAQSTNQNSPSNAPGSSSTPGSTGSSKPAPSPVSDSTKLITPYGTFVGNHHPTISSGGNNPGPDEESVCNTTPGATCTINFTKGTTVKELSPQQTDSGGSAYWKWDINSAGLTEGHWIVTVTASLNGKSLSATDALDVQP